MRRRYLTADAYVTHYPLAPAIDEDSPGNVTISGKSIGAVVIGVRAAVVIRTTNCCAQRKAAYEPGAKPAPPAAVMMLRLRSARTCANRKRRDCRAILRSKCS